MSDTANTKILEEAAQYIDEFEGTLIADVLELDLQRNDMEALYEHVADARVLHTNVAFEEEYNPEEA